MAQTPPPPHTHTGNQVFVIVLVLGFRDRVSLGIPGYPGSRSVDQADFGLRDPASVPSAQIKASLAVKI